jgi:hypothetical protein
MSKGLGQSLRQQRISTSSKMSLIGVRRDKAPAVALAQRTADTIAKSREDECKRRGDRCFDRAQRGCCTQGRRRLIAHFRYRVI